MNLAEPLMIRAASPNGDLLTFAAPVELVAAPAEGKRPSFTIVAYTGVPMSVNGYYNPVVVELSGVRASRKQIPILLDHDATRIVGQGEPKVDSASVRVEGIVTGEDSDSQKVVTHAKNGFQWQASIGAMPLRREFLEAGKKAVVNGREVTGPLLIVRESELREVSFVAMGADAQTEAAVAASHRKGMAMGFDAWLQAKGIDTAKIDDATRAVLKAAYEAEIKAQSPPPATPPAAGNPAPANPPAVQAAGQNGGQTYEGLDAIFQAQRREQSRRSEITRIAAEALKDSPAYVEQIEAASRKAIDEGTDPAAFELNVLRACRPQTGGLSGRRSVRSERMNDRVIEAAICQAVRLDQVEKRFDDQTLSAADKHFRGGIGLQELLLMAARENGYDGHSVRGSLETVLQYALPRDLRASAGFSTISLPSILSNVANKFITEAFLAVESAWRDISAIRPVNDFKTITNHSLTGDLQYEKVGPTGELKHGTLGEETYSNQADTYGKILAITRKDIVNDDLGAFAAVPRRLGRGGALAINHVFWTEFLANSSFFTSGRGNYDDGTDTALDAAGLAAALKLWALITDPDGKPLGTSPKIMLVPPGQWFAAAALMNASAMNAGGAATTPLIPNANVFAGMFKVVKSDYLANASYTGYSALAWYLLCDPRDIPVIETCFLGGREMPVVESASADFDKLGIQMRAYHDFGCTKQEWRGGMKLKGEN